MNMKLTKGLLGLGALLIAGQVNAEIVSLTPSVTSVVVNDPFTLTVQGSEFFDDVSSGSVEVSWDSTAMTLTSSVADLGASALANGFPLDFGVTTITTDSLTGLSTLSATYGTFATVFGPTFDFFSMDFVAIPPPSQTTLDIGIGAFGDWQSGTNPAFSITNVTYAGATVNVNPVPVPAAVWLFGSGLIGMVGIARRRKSQLV